MANKRPKPKILVVDDDPDMRIFFATLLKTGGFTPVVARDGAEGLEKAKDLAPEYIIIEVPMPGNGGMRMYRHLKQDKNTNGIPVMMVSGIDRHTFTHYQKTQGFRLGQDIPAPEAFLEKPPEAADVLERIETALARQNKGKKRPKGE